jgi:hypothetical protein
MLVLAYRQLQLTRFALLPAPLTIQELRVDDLERRLKPARLCRRVEHESKAHAVTLQHDRLAALHGIEKAR